MKDVIEIEGAYFSGSEEHPHLWRKCSNNGSLLGVATHSGDSLIRVAFYGRQDGEPQWKGTWWTKLDSSITDSLESAQQMVINRLENN